MTTKIAVLLTTTITGVALVSCKHDSVQPQSTLLFPKVKAIIQTNCLACHVPGGQGMPVFLNSDDNIVQLAGSIKHATVDPAGPQNPRMPLGGELSDADKKIITDWYAGGGTASN
jgi:uncharacterized membrane protein